MEPAGGNDKMSSRHEKCGKSQPPHPETRVPALSVIVTVVNGPDTVRRCLRALSPGTKAPFVEIIVPYDCESREVGELCGEFPEVNFHFIEDMGSAADLNLPSSKHRQYDRRRAVGVNLARGCIVAITEDYAVPSADWCQQILAAHEQPYAVIGGAINNGVDRAMNWALYYCDFGRYGSPLRCGAAQYASDVNIAYKREALMAVREVWQDAYRETVVNWTLRARGEKIFLDPRMMVEQHRPPVTLGEAYRERIEWGRMFAETRVLTGSLRRRVLYTLGVLLLPPLLTMRVLRHMLRQRRSLKQIATSLPLVAFLLSGWAVGELLGYLTGLPKTIVASGPTAHTEAEGRDCAPAKI